MRQNSDAAAAAPIRPAQHAQPAFIRRCLLPLLCQDQPGGSLSPLSAADELKKLRAELGEAR